MKLHLNLSLRRALLAAMAAVATFASSATAGVVDTRYDLQYYLDFSRNAGAFTAGATNVKVGYSDGSAVYTIPLMPYLGGFAQVSDSKALDQQLITHSGGAALVLPQFVYGAAHVFDQVKSNFDEGRLRYTFTDENAAASTAEVYAAANIDTFGHDGGVSRTTKLVTAVAYTPMATDAFMAGLNSSTWLYRLGNGGYWDSNGTAVSTGSNAIGGIINMDSYSQKANGDWYLYGTFRENGETSDPKTPLDNGVFKGDSGSPLFAWDDEQDRFVFVGSLWASNCHKGFGNDVYARYNPTLAQEAMAKYTVNATFSGTDTIAWSASDAKTGEGTLTQGDTIINYSGKGSANAMADTKGLSFATDSATQQEIQLQGNVNMGAGALTFTKGDWKITEAADYTLSSAGFEVQGGASLTLELTGTSGEEIRKVGEGTLTIAGSGKNEAALVVGGGTVIYNVEYKDGQIAGCTLGNAGETRLNRQEGYAASSVRLEGGVAIIVLMRDGQFKTDSGDTFTFGNDGGLLNLNGHDLTWGVINQDDSGKGARIGNFTPLGEATPGLSTFTYTGTGQFDGCFVDESNGDNDGKAQLAVVYNNATNDASWKLTGNNTNVGGYTVQAGTMILEGINTKHVRTSDANDWTFASIDGSDVTVQSGAKFQLSHHAKLVGDVIVEDGGKFIMNQAVNADYESDSGSSKINMAGKEFTTLVGDVRLNGNSSTMTANVQSSAITKIDGSIRMENYDWDASPTLQFVKEGNGILAVSGNVGVPVVEIRGGGLVIEQANALDWHQWTIGKEGFLAAIGVEHSTALDFKVNKTSDGVFALTYDQTTALNLTNKQNLYIGAWGEVHYGNAEASLSANNEGNWLLGGGTGTLIVDFKLTGDKDLIVGNEWSSGTVHLTNTGNDIKDIYIKGTGNKLTYESVAALGGATISLSYGNALGLYDANLLEVVNANSTGVLALASSADLNVGGRKLAMGALGDLTYQGNISLGDGDFYRFGGSGNLTVDTALNASGKMLVDGQGTTGSSVTFARENAFTGDIIVGGGLELETPNSQGDIALHAGHSSALAAANSINLQKGANFYTDGQNLIVQNLNAQSGSTISNNGSNNSSLVLYVTAGVNTSIANGVLNDNTNTAGLGIIKSGKGTVTMGENANWSGGLVIEDGKVEVSTAIKGTYTPSGGVGSSANTIYIGENGTLRVTASPVTGWNLYGTYLTQTVTGTGTIEIASGGSMLLTRQKTAFEGTVHVVDNTRLYLAGGNGFTANADALENLTALNSATIQVDAGSQVRLTPLLRYSNNTNKIHSYSDFIISGDGFAGRDSGLVQSGLNAGALAIDCGATVWGDVTLAADASISSSSSNPCDGAGNITTSYGVKNHLGGTIRGQILGEGKTLTIKGNESMTITADSANTYGNLVIANGNGNNIDKFALRLNGGKAVSQTSTALGKGEVTLNDKLILRLAGTGTANQTDVVYTYANNIAAGNGATIQSYNITNKLTGVVKAAGDLNLATAQGGVLNLAGGVSGSGTLNIGAASKVVLGDGVSSTVTFGGNVVADAGADLTLESAASLETTSTITGTDSLSLRLNGTTDYTLGGISVTEGAAALTLSFDFTKPEVSDWSTLNSDISAGSITIALDLNMFNEISSGEYTLISGNLPANGYALDASLGDRFGYRIEGGNFILVVGGDDRLYWSAEGSSQNWTESNWHVGGAGNLTSYSGSKDVMLTHAGLSSANNREMISVAGSLTVGQVNVSSLYGLEGAGSLAGTKLAVGAGGDLLLGVNASFSDGVLVNDASLEVGENTLTANVTAENKAQVALNGTALTGNITASESSSVALTDASVSGNIGLGVKSTMAMDNAHVTGSINLSGAGNIITENNSLTEGNAVASLSGTLNADGTGSLRLIDGSVTMDGKVMLDKLSIAASKRVTLRNANEDSGAEKSFGTLELGEAATLTVYNAVTNRTSESASIGSLTMAGSTAIIEEIQGSGYMKIGSLNMAEGVTSATLTLEKAANPAAPIQSTIFEIGSDSSSAGNFAGTVDVRQRYNHGGAEGHKHSVFITLSGSDTLSNAVVQMIYQPATKGLLGLGINAGGEGGIATIAGLVSDVSLGNRVLVFSGYAPQDVSWYNDEGFDKNLGEVARTLRINTAENKSYVYHGQVRENLSIVKQGAGKQTFSGNSANFNGSIEIQEGTLAFTGDALGMLGTASSVAVNGGTLDISGYDFNAGESLSINNFSFSEDSVLALGSLTAGATYEFFTADSMLDNWTSLTTDNFTIGGIALSEMGRVSLALGMDGSFSYSIDRWNLTWQGGSTGTWDMTAANEVWQTTRLDETTGAESTFNTGFTNGDNVTFGSDATVTLGSDILVSTMNVNSGTVVVKDSGSYAFNAGTVNVAANSHMQMWGDTGKAGADNVLSKVVMAEGATLSTNNRDTVSAATNVNTLVLNGKTANLKDEHHSGYIKVNELRLGEGIASSKLVLTKTSSSANVSVFEFGSASTDAGNFIGTLELIGGASVDESSGARSAGIIISHNTIARNAAISLSSNTSGHSASYLTLGINTANATIAGLSSGSSLSNHAVLYSGSVMPNESWGENNIDNGGTRTLTIETGKGTEYTFNGKVVNTDSSKLNLVKSGEGTQNFLGTGQFNSVKVEGGTLTLGGGMSKTTSNAYTVAANATLNISSTSPFSSTSTQTKEGDGTMVVYSKVDLGGMLEVKYGEFVVAYTGKEGNSIATLDSACQGAVGRGVFRLAQDVSLNVTSEIWGKKNAYIHLDKGAVLTRGNVVISNKSDSTVTKLGATTDGGTSYSADSGSWVLENGHIKSTASGITISNKLTNSSVENAGGGTLTVTNEANTLSGVVASAGDVTLQNLSATTSLNLLEIADGRTVNAYVGTKVNENQTVTVSGTALLSGTSTLNTSLTLNAGSTLDMVDLSAGAAIVTGALTFDGQVTMGNKLLAILDEMSSWESNGITLFTGMTSFTFNDEQVSAGSVLQASTIFSNVQAQDVYMEYHFDDNVGSLIVSRQIPEPTTATLSLLALAGLCARRRRKV